MVTKHWGGIKMKMRNLFNDLSEIKRQVSYGIDENYTKGYIKCSVNNNNNNSIAVKCLKLIEKRISEGEFDDIEMMKYIDHIGDYLVMKEELK